MIEFIRTMFREGDSIYISQKGQELGGKILSINDSFIVIETRDGNIIGVKDDAIESFSKESVVAPPKNTTTPNNAKYLTPNKENDAWGAKPKNYQQNYHQGYQQNYQNRQGNDQYGNRRDTKPKFKQYKPGDRIPLEFLTQRDPSLADSWKKKEENRQKSNLVKSAMKEAFDELKATNNDKLQEVAHAIGAIVELKPSFQFGFIDDRQTGERYFYNKGDIVDASLRNESDDQVEVIYLRSRNHKGATAKCIMRPQSVEQIIGIAMELVAEDDYLRAKQVLQIATEALPENESAKAMQEKFNEALKENGVGNTSQDDATYAAARAALEQRNYSQALKLYTECMEKGVRKTNCIKEIAQVFISLHAQEKDETQKEAIRKRGLEFINEHRSELPDKPNTWFSLENIYFALGDYDKHIDVVEDIISETGTNGELDRYVFYLNKAAQSYLRIRDYERALDAANQGLEVAPDNSHLLKTKASIDEELNAANAPQKEEESQEDEETPFSMHSV